ncbi:MAG TPA: tRNA (adenosine(37)-N6)-threonylcarbamoyltransferase complex dimerization subunit type 1 TsaB [Methylibium sp.]|nr:tRNA (adenosine(37)-N6)-threonylcarbamoyltransferase complex dimerization subunit type 1 TsaB [Methylibium sp.]
MSAASAPTPPLLVLDCATETLHLGLAVEGRTWLRALPGGAQASTALLPALMELLAEAGLRLRDLGAIGFGRGPGAFTGVRTACAVTQGLAFGAGLPVLALDTLMAVAEDARCAGADDDDMWVAVDARMGETYAARYRRGTDGWTALAAPALHDPAALAAQVRGGGVAGSSLTAHAPAWADHAGPRWPDAAPRAAALLALARAAWQRGERLDAAEALPLYVRDKVAQTTAERAALAARRAA